MLEGEIVTFKQLLDSGYKLYDQNQDFQIWSNWNEWVYVANGVITKVTPMERRPFVPTFLDDLGG